MTLMMSHSFHDWTFTEDVLLGNDVIFKCKIPSFVDDYVHIINWVDNDGVDYYPRIEKGKEELGL